jgi:hypothetical protein
VEVEVFRGPAADPRAPLDLLIEVPHGATRRRHFEAARDRLRSVLPADLEAFFFVNTDVGAPECARQVARLVAGDRAGRRQVLVVRGLVPRTFIDCNRLLDAAGHDMGAAGFTPVLPEYVTDPADVELLHGLYRRYQEVAGLAYERVCGAGGSALIVHSYAPRSVDIQRVDADIVRALREAYEPQRFATWPERPPVDLISRADDDTLLAPAGWVQAAIRRYAAIDVPVAQNATYRLHPKTLGHRHSVDWPDRVLCLELNRALLADPFTPFEEMRIGSARVERMAAPLAAAWLDRDGVKS